MNKTTAADIIKLKRDGKPVVCLTAYDYPTGAVVDEAGVDLILVGDTVGMVVQGRENTLAVTVDEMVYHVAMVKRATERAMLVADMPFMSFQESDEETLHNAGRLIKEGGAEAVKLEGATPDTVRRIKKIVGSGVPVMGHLGYTPQSFHYFGRHIVQGKTAARARVMVEQALLLQEAGCFSIVLEMVPRQLAGLISRKLYVPTIGIGSGAECDGQILVLHDLVGFYRGYIPKFVRKLADVNEAMREAVVQYGELVRNGEYPADEESVEMAEDAWAEISELDRPDEG
ncbi:MAG: 3-methyl-2-oxobutanoate hydroxymethyltransferase [Candidatus Zixiibacteriota bacterium]|jgi:3-methyl-2-oxobutanoate hydroxymethyltransferase